MTHDRMTVGDEPDVEIKNVLLLHLKPGDKLIAMTDMHMPIDATVHLKKVLQEKLGVEDVFVLTGGIKLAVLRNDTAG